LAEPAPSGADQDPRSHPIRHCRDHVHRRRGVDHGHAAEADEHRRVTIGQPGVEIGVYILLPEPLFQVTVRCQEPDDRPMSRVVI
jgi:hypothetical protein